MKNHDTKIKLAFLSVAALAMFGLLAFGWYGIKRENRETAALLLTAGISEAAEREEQAIRAVMSDAQEEIDAFNAIVLTNDKLVSLIEDIEAIGEDLDLKLRIASVEKTEAEGSASQLIRIAVEAEGSWSGAYSLLEAVESLPYRITVEGVGLTRGSNGWSESVAFKVHSFK